MGHILCDWNPPVSAFLCIRWSGKVANTRINRPKQMLVALIKAVPSLSNLIIERLGTFRCPTIGLLSAVFRSALGLQAQTLPPNGVSLVIRLIPFPQWLCFACSSVLLSELRHSAGDFRAMLILL